MADTYIDLVGRQSGVNPDGSQYDDPEDPAYLDHLRKQYLQNSQMEADQFNRTGVKSGFGPYMRQQQFQQTRQDTNQNRQTQNGFMERRLQQADQRQNDANQYRGQSLGFRQQKQADSNSQFDQNLGFKQEGFKAKQAAAEQAKQLKIAQAQALLQAMGVQGGAGQAGGQAMSPDEASGIMELYGPKKDVPKVMKRHKAAGIYMPNDQVYQPDGLMGNGADGMHKLSAGDEVRQGDGGTFDYQPVYDEVAGDQPELSQTAQMMKFAGMTPDLARQRMRSQFGMGAEKAPDAGKAWMQPQMEAAAGKAHSMAAEQKDGMHLYLNLVGNGYTPEDAAKMVGLEHPGIDTGAFAGFNPKPVDPQAEMLKKMQDKEQAAQQLQEQTKRMAQFELRDALQNDPKNQQYHFNQIAKKYKVAPEALMADFDMPDQADKHFVDPAVIPADLPPEVQAQKLQEYEKALRIEGVDPKTIEAGKRKLAHDMAMKSTIAGYDPKTRGHAGQYDVPLLSNAARMSVAPLTAGATALSRLFGN
jgi:hypothetical protein